MFRILTIDGSTTPIINESSKPLYGKSDEGNEYIILPEGELAIDNIELPSVVWSYNAA